MKKWRIGNQFQKHIDQASLFSKQGRGPRRGCFFMVHGACTSSHRIHEHNDTAPSSGLFLQRSSHDTCVRNFILRLLYPAGYAAFGKATVSYKKVVAAARFVPPGLSICPRPSNRQKISSGYCGLYFYFSVQSLGFFPLGYICDKKRGCPS